MKYIGGKIATTNPTAGLIPTETYSNNDASWDKKTKNVNAKIISEAQNFAIAQTHIGAAGSGWHT